MAAPSPAATMSTAVTGPASPEQPLSSNLVNLTGTSLRLATLGVTNGGEPIVLPAGRFRLQVDRRAATFGSFEVQAPATDGQEDARSYALATYRTHTNVSLVRADDSGNADGTRDQMSAYYARSLLHHARVIVDEEDAPLLIAYLNVIGAHAIVYVPMSGALFGRQDVFALKCVCGVG